MNEDLQSYIEPELEARIAALVLGEASAFETGELERLMSERLELKSYRIGLEKIHGLLEEAHEEQNDSEWKLSEESRGKILVKINESKREEIVEKRRKRIAMIAQRRLIYTLAACLFLTLVIVVLNQPRGLEGERSSIVDDSSLALTENNLARGLPSSESSVSSMPAIGEGQPIPRLDFVEAGEEAKRNAIGAGAKLKNNNDSPSSESLKLRSSNEKKDSSWFKSRAALAEGQVEEGGVLGASYSVEGKAKGENDGLNAKAQSVPLSDQEEALAVLEEPEIIADSGSLGVGAQSAPDGNQAKVLEPEKEFKNQNTVEPWSTRILIYIVILLVLIFTWRLAKQSR